MNWTCPYCDRDQYITDNRNSSDCPIEQEGSTLGKVLIRVTSTTCANKDCRKLTLRADLYENLGYQVRNYKLGKLRGIWSLLPGSSAKPQPDYIPLPIRDDYEQACKIRTLSPKASATLSRRCLQGMIRDFCGISKPRLIDEIKELKQRLDDGKAPTGVMPDSVEAIDHVRSIGNIGAHMEKDINVIVDIDPEEATILIGLIELLFKEWYVARHQRAERLAELKRIADAKAEDKKASGEKE